MNLKALTPKRQERMAIFGRTGSGKTTLSRHILLASDYERILVVDPKCTYGGPSGEAGYEMVRKPWELRGLGSRHKRIQYRPHPKHQSILDYEAVYEWAYRQGGILVYTDELYLTMHGTQSPDWQRACITSGRELGVGMIMASQRPRGIDPRVRTEADVKAQFDLEEEEDVITVWGRTRAKRILEAEEASPPPRFSFWFHRPEMGRMPKLTRLNIK